MKFVADSTVGKLARLLRMAGFDCDWVSTPDIAQVLSLSREQQRMIVSRNSKFSEMVLAADFYHVRSDDPEKQLVDLLLDLNLPLKSDNFLSRCVDCNEPLNEVSKEDVRERTYPYVYHTQKYLFICRHCDKLFWRATHAKAMTDRLQRISVELDRRRQRQSSS